MKECVTAYSDMRFDDSAGCCGWLDVVVWIGQRSSKKKAAAADAAADAVTAMLPQMTNIDELQAEDLQAAIIETTSFDSSDLMVMRRPNQSTKEAECAFGRALPRCWPAFVPASEGMW